MKETMISPLAYVDPSARLGKMLRYIRLLYRQKCEIGDDNVIMPYASLMSGTRMGNGNEVYQGAVVAAVPQDFAYTGEDTLAYIGNNNVIRENAVIIRGTHAGHATSVGDGNFIMTGARLSHDVEVGNHCIIGNGSQVSGNCIIQDCAILTSNVLMQGNTRLEVTLWYRRMPFYQRYSSLYRGSSRTYCFLQHKYESARACWFL